MHITLKYIHTKFGSYLSISFREESWKIVNNNRYNKDLFINEKKLKITVKPEDIQAIHRIPGQNKQHRPILVKLRNSDVKYNIMKGKKNLPLEKTFSLVDDVTKHNMDLIS